MLLLLALLAASEPRVQLSIDTSEAEAVLAHDWKRLFSSEPYRRLKQREAAIAERFHEPSIVISDEKFRAFVLSKDTTGLEETLARWKHADLDAIAARVLPYLPPSAVLRARIYPVIKPATNSFVWDMATNPAIFLFLDPGVGREKFENTVAHELHHVGLTSALAEYEQRIEAMRERPRMVARSIEAFGEGLAMLAAAGSPDADPQAASSPAEKARWARDLANFDQDLRTMDAFFLDALQGRLTPGAIEEKAGSFYGEQGPWYTVGYRMAALVEKRLGRAALIETMLDPRLLLVRYNAVAEPGMPRWSQAVLIGLTAD
jgi:hypothetical protein